MSMNIVLLEPEMPANTGNIGRTCVATGTKLHLIKPLGFEISDRYLKRAGLDYWHMMELRVHEDWAAFMAAYPGAELFFTSKKAPRDYCQARYPDEPFFVFGRESRGLPEDMLREHWERCVRIPMREGARSLNLSNAVAIVTYEALRQLGFPGMKSAGKFGEY